MGGLGMKPAAIMAAVLTAVSAFAGLAGGTSPVHVAGTDIPPGHISAPQTWTAAGSPYRVLGTIIIDAGVVVRAQPGTVISPLAGVRVFVDGALMLEGSSTTKVRVNTTGAPWGGIQYNVSTIKSWSNHTDVTDATVAIEVKGGNVELANSTIAASSTGVATDGGWLSLKDSTITSLGHGIVSDRARFFADRIIAMGGNGSPANSTRNGTTGGTGLVISRAGAAGSTPGQSIIGNSTFTGGAGGANWFADRRAGDGGTGLVIRASIQVGLVNLSGSGGAGGNNSGTASTFASARGGDGGPAVVVDGSNSTTFFRGTSLGGGAGGPTSSAAPSRAGDGGAVFLIGPNRSHNTTLFNFDAVGGQGGSATGAGVHPGNGGPAILIVKGDDNLISSVRSYGGRGGDGAPLNGDGGHGGHGLHVLNARRVFYYVVTLEGGRGGDTWIASAEPAGEGGDGVRMEYAETLFAELGYLIGGRGGDNHHPSGSGGGKGGSGVRFLGGQFRLETGEADMAAGEGGDNHNATNGRAGDAADAAVNVTGGSGVLVEFSRMIPARGGRDFTGGPDGKPSDGIRISAPGTRMFVASVDGILGVTPVCARVSNATVEFSGNAFFRCDVGILVETPAGGNKANVTGRADYTYQTRTGVLVRSGSAGWFTELNVDNSTDVGVHVDGGATPRFDLAEIHSSSLTNDSIKVTGGARPYFYKSDIRNSRVNDYHVSGDSMLTLVDTRHVYGKGVVLDTSSMWVKNLLQFKTVDSRWSPAPRGFVEVFDNGTRIFAMQIFKGGGCGPGGIPCSVVVTDRVHRASGMWENHTKVTNVYKNWTWRAVPGPIDDMNMSTPHFEWLVGSGIAPPRVNRTVPSDGATGVPPGSSIRVDFSVPMDRASVEGAIKASAPNFGDFTWTSDGKNVTFRVRPWLLPDTTYTFNISSSIAKDTLGYQLDGNRNGENEGSPLDDYEFSFTTGPKPTLKVLGNGSAPGNVSQGEAWVPFLIADYIAEKAPVLADRVEISMYGDATDADVRDVSLWMDANGNARWDLGDKALGFGKFAAGKATFNTSAAVSPAKVEHFFVVLNISQDALIDARVGVQIADEAAVSVTGGNVALPVKPLRSGLARIVGDLIPPQVVAYVPSGSDVPVDTSIAVTFSEPMNWTATAASFAIDPAVPMNRTVTGNTVILKPLQLLEPGTDYTVKVLGSAARDRAGNLFDGNRNGISEGSPNDDFSFSFRTKVPSQAILRGVVTDDLGGTVSGARVDLAVTGTNTTGSATTNTTGHFEIAVQVAGTVDAEVRVSKPSYLAQTFPAVQVRGGEVVWKNLTLPEDVGSVEVTVLEPGGGPAASATVILVGANRSGATDTAGQVLFTRVRSGNYTVRALKSGFGEETGKLEVKSRSTAEITLRFRAPADSTLAIALAVGALVAAAVVLISYFFLRKRRSKRDLPSVDAKKDGPDRPPEDAKASAAAKAAASRSNEPKDPKTPK